MDDEFDDDLETCPKCDGEGFLLDGCFEDTCCCEDPGLDHDIIPCDICNAALVQP